SYRNKSPGQFFPTRSRFRGQPVLGFVSFISSPQCRVLSVALRSLLSLRLPGVVSCAADGVFLFGSQKSLRDRCNKDLPLSGYRAIAGTNARASISQLPDVYTHTNTHQTRAKASTSNNNNS
uniref:Uncharacterized protein n=1 Tax=Anopheles dirus TaxID=7168 RepID=A0A182NVZ1_9DIPT